MFIGLFVVLAALTSYLLLWPEPSSTMTPNTSNKLANASSQPTDTVVEEPQRINEKTQKESIQTSSKNETQLAAPDKVNETQGKAAPVDKKASADRPPAIFTAQTNPAPDPLPYISVVNNGVTVPGKAGTDAAVVAALATAKLEPKANLTRQQDLVEQENRPAQMADPDSWDQAAVPAAEAASELDPSTGTPTFESPVSEAGKAAAAMVAVLAAEPVPIVDPAPRKETVVPDAPPAREVDTGADDQAAEPAVNAAPKADPTTDRPAVESDATTLWQGGSRRGCGRCPGRHQTKLTSETSHFG